MPYAIPATHLLEPECIPSFWISKVGDVENYLQHAVHHGAVDEIGQSAGRRSLYCTTYGHPRDSSGTTTFSGALGFRDIKAYLGPEYNKRVYMAMGGIHGAEFEGIVGIINLISILETGHDLRGKDWPEITKISQQLDRIILIPIVNVDGRERVPIRMQIHHGNESTVQEYLNTGGKKDGTLIGWPECKAHIPLDFETTQFPGGYPNDAGVNIQHDDFLGSRQPETESLFILTAQERPDLIVNMHTGAPGNNYFTRAHRPFIEPVLNPNFNELYRSIHTRLTLAGLQSSDDVEIEADPTQLKCGPYNLDTALNLQCGALTILIESPCHGFSGTDRTGKIVVQSADNLLDAQLNCHLASMEYLLETGGTWKWHSGTI
ncbi:MAG: M14 family zinc carboxypeptidase [Anaerolineae bacterium]|nr:M14 family zinc carboxypeptidase [Anaerolineae bacterium]